MYLLNLLYLNILGKSGRYFSISASFTQGEFLLVNCEKLSLENKTFSVS